MEPIAADDPMWEAYTMLGFLAAQMREMTLSAFVTGVM